MPWLFPNHPFISGDYIPDYLIIFREISHTIPLSLELITQTVLLSRKIISCAISLSLKIYPTLSLYLSYTIYLSGLNIPTSHTKIQTSSYPFQNFWNASVFSRFFCKPFIMFGCLIQYFKPCAIKHLKYTIFLITPLTFTNSSEAEYCTHFCNSDMQIWFLYLLDSVSWTSFILCR